RPPGETCGVRLPSAVYLVGDSSTREQISMFENVLIFGGPLGAGSALRLRPSGLVPMEGILCDRAQLLVPDLAVLGFERVATRNSQEPLPTLSIGADISLRTEVDFLDENGNTLGGFVFDDDHPDEWWNPVHKNGRLLVLVG